LAALVEVSADPAGMRTMRQAARRSAERFSPEQATEWWDDFYDQACIGIVLAA
jgi:hypothetical protein